MRKSGHLLLLLAFFLFTNANAQNPVSLGSGSYADAPPEAVWDEGAYYGMTYRQLRDGWPWHIHENKQADAIPTNDWWTATIFEQYTGNLEAYPHRVQGTSNGVKVSVPTSFSMFDARGLSVTMGTSITVKGSVEPEQSGDTEIFADFESASYPTGWSVSDNPPYPGPVSLADFEQSPTPNGFLGDRFINTFNGDAPQVTLTSPDFTITKNYIHFLFGGGSDIDLNYIGLYINGNRVLAETGASSAEMVWKKFDVSDYIGQTAQIRIVDASSGGWGFTLCDNIVFSNKEEVSSSFSNSFWPQDAKAYDWSDLGLVFRLEDDQAHYMDVSSYHGIPYTFIDLKEVNPLIETSSTPEEIYSASGQAINTFPYNGNTIVVNVDGKLFGIHAPNGTTFAKSPAGNFVPQIPASAPQYLVISVIPNTSLISDYDALARNKVTKTTFGWNYNQEAGKIETSFKLDVSNYETGAADGETLLALLPHHWRNTSGYTTVPGAEYQTMNGLMKTAQGSNITISYDFGGMPPYLAKPLNLNAAKTQRLNDLLSAKINVSEDYNGNTYAKGFGEESNIMLMAKELGHPGFETIKNNIKSEFENWLTYQPSEASKGSYFFADYPQFGALIGYPVGFGSQAFNDLHFHFGYFIVGAARLMMVDEQFKNEYGEMIKRIAKSYANWKRYGVNDDDKEPFLRNFDPYAGHSWAGGVGNGGDGNNQESTSEATHSWFGMYLLGMALEDDELLSLGATGFMLEGISAETYWFDRHEDMPSAYAFDYVGILKANNMAMATFFDGDPAWAFGIQAVPCDFFYSYYLGKDPALAKNDFESMLQDRVEFGEFPSTNYYDNIAEMGAYLGGYHLNYINSYDPAYVATTLDNLIDQEGGDWGTSVNSATNYYIANANLTYGLPAEGYHTSLATGGVFKDANGEISVLIYNYTSSSQDVNVYYNGAVIQTVTIGAKQYYNSKLGDNPVQAPSVNAGADQTLTAATSTTLTGSATDDGTIVSYAWTQVSGPAANIVSAASATTEVNGLTDGTYVFRLTAIDNDQLSGSDEVKVTISSTPTTCSGLAVTEATASSQEGAFAAANAIDGDVGTRWSSEFSLPQWIKLDLGESYDINEATLIWERASAESYYLMVSNTNSTPDPNSADWTIISTQTGKADEARTDNITGLSGCGRYVAMYATNKLHDYGFSLFEFTVCGISCTSNNDGDSDDEDSTSEAPIGSLIWLQANNGLYVSSENGENPMIANRAAAAGWENFTVVDAGNGLVALQGSNGLYVTTTSPMYCNGTTINASTSFTWETLDNGISLKGGNNLYVSSENGETSMNCSRATAGEWEIFNWGVVAQAARLASNEISTTGGIYPNPAATNLTFHSGDLKEGDMIQVYSMNGHKVLSVKSDSNNQTLIDINHLKPGLYLLKIVGDTGTYKFYKH